MDLNPSTFADINVQKKTIADIIQIQFEYFQNSQNNLNNIIKLLIIKLNWALIKIIKYLDSVTV